AAPAARPQVRQLRNRRFLREGVPAGAGKLGMTTENSLRERIALHGRSLFERGYGCGSSGNISVRLEDGILVTPTNSSMGRLDPARISKLDWEGGLVSGDKPSKEAFLHLAMYQERPEEKAVVHLHSTHSVAVSCLAEIDP